MLIKLFFNKKIKKDDQKIKFLLFIKNAKNKKKLIIKLQPRQILQFYHKKK